MPAIPKRTKTDYLNRTRGSLSLTQTKQMRGIAKRIVEQLQDHKAYPVFLSTTALLQNDTLATNLLYGIIQGTGTGQRIGANINLKGVALNFGFTMAASASPNSNFIRVRVYRDNEQTFTGGYSTVTLANAGTVGFAQNSMPNITQGVNSKFNISCLYDRYFEINQMASTVSGGNVVKTLRAYVKLDKAAQGKPYYFEDGTGSQYGKKFNFYLAISGFTPGGTNHSTQVCNVDCNYQVYYRD